MRSARCRRGNRRHRSWADPGPAEATAAHDGGNRYDGQHDRGDECDVLLHPLPPPPRVSRSETRLLAPADRSGDREDRRVRRVRGAAPW